MSEAILPQGQSNYFIPGHQFVMTPVQITAEEGETPFTVADDLRVRIESQYETSDDVYDSDSPELSVTDITDGVEIGLTLSGSQTAKLGEACPSNSQGVKLMIETGPPDNPRALFWFTLKSDPSNFKADR